MDGSDAESPDFVFKIVMIGDQAVGKSSLILRFSEDKFSENRIETIGVDFKLRTINLDGKVIKLFVWDTAGDERFRTFTSAYYRGAHGIMIVYDVTRPDTFNSVPSWLNEVQKMVGEDGVSKLLIGNKADLRMSKMVDTHSAQCFAREHNMQFIQTSAKDTKNVNNAFFVMAQEILERIQGAAEMVTDDNDIIHLSDSTSVEDSSWSSCCY